MMRAREGGGDTQLFFGWYVPHRFPKVGYREQVFLEKIGVLGAKIQEFCTLRAEILAENKAENAKFFKIENGEHLSGALMVNW